MKPSATSNDWLVLLLYGFDTIMNPYTQNLLETFESWNYRHRLRYDLMELRRSKMLESQKIKHRLRWGLAEAGRLAAFGGVDVAARWSRKWDGRWRLLLFDLPVRQRKLRLGLWRWLRGHRFGYLQQSVWITPDSIDETSIPLHPLMLTPESLTVIEGVPAPSRTDESIVQSAWDFELINRAYREAMELAADGRRFVHGGEPAKMRVWLADERAAWVKAVTNDPLLPEDLLPKDYLGRKAFHERQSTFHDLGRTLPSRRNQ